MYKIHGIFIEKYNDTCQLQIQWHITDESVLHQQSFPRWRLLYPVNRTISSFKQNLPIETRSGSNCDCRYWFHFTKYIKKSCMTNFTKYENISLEHSPPWEAERFQSTPNIVFLTNLYSHVGLPSDLFPSDFQTKVLYARSALSLPTLLHIPRRRRWTMNFSLCDFLNRPLATCTLVPASISLSNSLSSTLSIYYFLRFCLNGTSFHVIYGVLSSPIVCL